MRSLLWKDYRMNRLLLIIGATIIAATYGAGAVAEVSAGWPDMPTRVAWSEMLTTYGTVALYLTAFVTALLGGNAIACERSDRSAHFLAYLPPARWQILVSKFVVAAAAVAAMWAWVLGSVWVVAPLLSGGSGRGEFLGKVTVVAVGQLCALTFGTGWLASAFVGSATFAVVAALASPVVMGFVLMVVFTLLGIPRYEMGNWSGVICFWAGVGGFVVGSWAYLRRVEP